MSRILSGIITNVYKITMMKVITEMRGMKGITNITNQKLQQIISTTKHLVMTSALLFLGCSTIGLFTSLNGLTHLTRALLYQSVYLFCQ